MTASAGKGGEEGRAGLVRDGLTGVLAFGCGGALEVWAAKGKGSGLEAASFAEGGTSSRHHRLRLTYVVRSRRVLTSGRSHKLNQEDI